MNPSSAPSTLALARAEFDWAKRLFGWRYLAHALTALFAIAGLFVASDQAAAFTSAAAFSEIVAFAMRMQAKKAQARAAQGLRYALIEDSFGTMPWWFPILELKLTFSSYANAHATEMEDSAYYSSDANPGPTRFAENLAESATYSSILCESAAKRIANPLLVFTPPLMLVLALSIALLSREVAIIETAVLGAIFAGLIGSDVVATMVEFGDAAETSNDVLKWLEVHKKHASDGDLYAIAADYADAMASCPPIPTREHASNKDRIAEALQRTSGSGSSPP